MPEDMGVGGAGSARRTARSVWTVVGALWLCAGAVLLLRQALPGESPASAPATPPPAAAAAQTAPLAALGSQIPPLPLIEALERLSRQTGAQLVWTTGLVSNQQTRGAPAGLTAAEALTRLLEGTELRFESLTLRTFRIVDTVRPPTDAPLPPPQDVSPCIRRVRC